MGIRHLAIGMALAGHANWPTEKIAALNDEQDAMLQVIREGEYFSTSRLNCSGFEKFNLLISEVARVGMVAALRQRNEAVQGRTSVLHTQKPALSGMTGSRGKGQRQRIGMRITPDKKSGRRIGRPQAA